MRLLDTRSFYMSQGGDGDGRVYSCLVIVEKVASSIVIVSFFLYSLCIVKKVFLFSYFRPTELPPFPFEAPLPPFPASCASPNDECCTSHHQRCHFSNPIRKSPGRHPSTHYQYRAPALPYRDGTLRARPQPGADLHLGKIRCCELPKRCEWSRLIQGVCCRGVWWERRRKGGFGERG